MKRLQVHSIASGILTSILGLLLLFGCAPGTLQSSDGNDPLVASHPYSGIVGELALGRQGRGRLNGIDGAASFHTYIVEVPPNTTRLTIRMEADEDLDLYVKHGSEIWSYEEHPVGDWEYRDITLRSSAELVIADPLPGAWYIDVANGLGASADGRYELTIETGVTSTAPNDDVPQAVSATAEAERFLQDGIDRLGDGNLDGAIAAFTDAIDLDPGLAVAYLGRCQAHLFLWISSRAVEDCTAAIETLAVDHPMLPSALNMRGNAHFDLGLYERAIDDHTRALELRADDTVALIQRARAYGASGHYRQAVEDIDLALLFDDGDAMAYLTRGDILSAMEEWDLAIADYIEAVALDPYLFDAYVALFGLYDDLDRLDEGIAVFGDAATRVPDNSMALYFRGDANLALWNLEAAIADYTESLEIYETVEAYIQRGFAYGQLGRPDLEVEDVTAVLRFDPDNALAYNNRAFALLQMQELDRALADAQQSLLIAPNQPYAFDTRGAIYLAMGELELAIADLTLAIELDPTSIDPWSNRARALLESGRLDLALSDCERALALAPDSPADYRKRGEALHTRGRIHALQGRSDLALTDLRAALDLVAPMLREEIRQEILEVEAL